MYVKVRWIHTADDMPVMLYSELDAQMWETRKVELYANGHADFANGELGSGTTELGSKPSPPLQQLVDDPEFEPVVISAEEFELIWKLATSNSKSSPRPR